MYILDPTHYASVVCTVQIGASSLPSFSRQNRGGRVKWELHLLLRVTSFCYINCMLSCLLWCSWEEATRGKKLPQFLSAYFHSPVLLWGKVRWARCLHRSSTELAVCVVCPQPAFRSCESLSCESERELRASLAMVVLLSFLAVFMPFPFSLC